MSIIRRVPRFVVALLVAVMIVLATMLMLAEARPVQRDLTVEISGLRVNSRPLRLVLLSDFHVGKMGDTSERLRETVDRVAALHPDVVLLAGDFIAEGLPGFIPIRPGVASLARLRPPLGMFAVLGNHDYKATKGVQRSLREIGVHLLDNDAARAGPLALVGVSDAFSHHDRLPLALSAARRIGGVPVVFTHSPDVIPSLPAGIELALAGHTHCGQIVLPFVGALETRSRYGDRYRCGIVREARRTAVITSGLGVSRVPLRLGAPPDFWVITVVPKRARG